jgi:23S rRNA (guanosine2251-2'-O)-methyltransferase
VILTGGVRTGSDGILARSSAGASERMPLFTADPAGAVDLFKSKGYKIVSADLPNSVSVYEANLTKPLLLVIGGERRGITRSVLEKSDAIVRLDYGRPFEAALSAASAASILAFEVFRQNRG